MTLRRGLLRLHLWAGLLLGAFWLVQGLTGAALVFNRDVQRVYLDTGTRSDRLPLDMLLSRIGRVLGTPVTKIETFGPDTMLLLAYHDTPQGERAAVVDMRTAAVLEQRDMHARSPAGGSAWPWLLRLHEALLAGDGGLVAVGCLGMMLAASLALGLWNAMPYRSWRQARRMMRMNRTHQRLAGWHRLVGLIVAPALLVMTLCGVYLAFAPQLRPVLADMAGYKTPFKPEALNAPPVVTFSAEHAYLIAQQHFPGATLMRLVLPTAKSPVYLFRMLQPDDSRRWAGTSTIAIDPRSGKVVDAFDSRTAPLANRATDWIYSLHTGDVGGLAGRGLVFLAGLSLPLFCLTGWIAWWRRRAERRTPDMLERSQ